MSKFRILKLACPLICLSSLGFLAFGCGGDNGGTTTAATTTAATTSGGNTVISGTVIKGPVQGGNVTAYGVNNGNKGSQLGSATTDAQGNFSMTIGAYSGPVMLSMSGGSYTDEATGSMMTMATNDVDDRRHSLDIERRRGHRNPDDPAHFNGPGDGG